MKRAMFAMSSALVFLSTTPIWAQPASPPASTPAASPAIVDGSRVQLEYTLKEVSGEVLDSNKGGTPLIYVQGEHKIMPVIERALQGMRTGEEKQVTVPPEDGYGAVDPGAQTEVPKHAVPPAALTVGSQLTAETSSGQTRLVRVKEIKEETVVLDLNHPLAGKTLQVDVRVLGVDPPAK
jgi:FKBP-type peptidyl-prolyl cis-trans isomerase SlyD